VLRFAPNTINGAAARLDCFAVLEMTQDFNLP
jgi:hypothetical protein